MNVPNWMNEWMKQLLIQNTPEELQDTHLTKTFVWNKNNSTIVLLKLEMSYSLELKMSWLLRKKQENRLLEKAEMSQLSSKYRFKMSL